MQNWTISTIMTAMAVVAFVVMLTQAEGCGEHSSSISDLQLAPDEQTLVVSRADARVSHDGIRRIFRNLWRSRALIRSSDGSVVKLLESRPGGHDTGELRSGSCAPWFSFCQQRLYCPMDHELVCYDFQGQLQSKTQLPGGVASVAVAADEKQLLYCDVITSTASLVTLADKQIVWKKDCGTIGPRYHGCALAISDEHFAILDHDQLQYGQLLGKGQHSTMRLRMHSDRPHAVHFVKHGTLIVVAFGDFFHLVDVATGKPEKIAGRCLGKSPDGRRLLVDSLDSNEIRVMDVETGEKSAPLFVGGWPDIGCVSSDGARVYLGDNNRVYCVDAATGKQLWSRYAPGHYRPGMGWLILLAIASVLGWRWYIKRSLHRLKTELETEDQLTPFG